MEKHSNEMIPLCINLIIYSSSHKCNLCFHFLRVSCLCVYECVADMTKKICLRWSEANDLIEHERATYIQLNLLLTNEKKKKMSPSKAYESALRIALCVIRSELQFSDSPSAECSVCDVPALHSITDIHI